MNLVDDDLEGVVSPDEFPKEQLNVMGEGESRVKEKGHKSLTGFASFVSLMTIAESMPQKKSSLKTSTLWRHTSLEHNWVS